MIDFRVSLITLGVGDLDVSRNFYVHGMGFEVSSASQGDVVFLKSRGVVISLYPRTLLAEDVTVSDAGTGFRAITLAHNVERKEDVALTLRRAESAGAKIMKPAQDVFWGGHSGYFADPDGHLWEVAWNPFFKMNSNGELELP